MLKIVVGHSEQIDSIDAANEAIGLCDAALEGIKPKAGILFSAFMHEHAAILDKILERYPGIELVGCTTDGELSSANGFMEDSLVLTLFCSDEAEIAAGIGRDISNNAKEAIAASVAEAKRKLSREATVCLALPDITFMNGVAVVDGLSAALGRNVAVAGGGPANQNGRKDVLQFYGREILSGASIVLLFTDPVVCSFGVASGWKPVGQKKTVTRSSGNTIYEIDGKPAAEFYTKYFGCEGEIFGGEFPMLIFENGEERPFIRAVLKISCGTGELRTAGIVSEGAVVQFAEATREDIIAGAGESVAAARDSFAGTPAALFAFSCAARKNILGTKTREEAAVIARTADLGCVTTGFYTYGEICPLALGHAPKFHNATLVTLILGTK